MPFKFKKKVLTHIRGETDDRFGIVPANPKFAFVFQLPVLLVYFTIGLIIPMES